MHIHKITGRSLHFGKVLLAASHKILFTSIVTSIFTQDEQTEKREQECDQKIQAPLLEEIDKINHDRMYPHIQLTSFERRTSRGSPNKPSLIKNSIVLGYTN